MPSFMGHPKGQGQCQTDTWRWNRYVEGRKFLELFQTGGCEGCSFFSVYIWGNTLSVGGIWLRDLLDVYFWPQSFFRSQNISCPFKCRTANSFLWQRGKLWSTRNLYEQAKRYISTATTVIQAWQQLRSKFCHPWSGEKAFHGLQKGWTPYDFSGGNSRRTDRWETRRAVGPAL